MIIKPRVRGFICVTAHPVGCEANVKEQIDYVTKNGVIEGGPKKVLVLGASTGYGLAARISAAFGCGADTLGVFFEKEGEEGKLSSAGWYNSAAFEKFAVEKGLYAKSINGDAFSDEIKRLTIDTIRKDLGKIDLVVYSLAAPRRTDPQGVVHNSTLKPIGEPITLRGLDTDKEVLTETTLQPASAEEIAGTVQVMGGEDWQMWIDALADAGGNGLSASVAAVFCRSRPERRKRQRPWAKASLVLRSPKKGPCSTRWLQTMAISILPLRQRALARRRCRCPTRSGQRSSRVVFMAAPWGHWPTSLAATRP